MKKRRISVQSLFHGQKDQPPELIPETPPPPLSPSRPFNTLPRSFGAQILYDAPQLDGLVPSDSFLLDDDPFADLSGPRTKSITDVPKSPPLSPLTAAHVLPPPPPPPSPPQPPSSPVRTVSSNTTPAHQKPAFRSRPSLPSLSTLARMNVAMPKVRRGHVGAGLPAEPWDLEPDALPVPSPPTLSPPSASPSEISNLTPVNASGGKTPHQSSPVSPQAPSAPISAPDSEAEAKPEGLPFPVLAVPLPPPIIGPTPTTLGPVSPSTLNPVPHSPIRMVHPSAPRQYVASEAPNPRVDTVSQSSTPSGTFLDLSSDSGSDEEDVATSESPARPAASSSLVEKANSPTPIPSSFESIPAPHKSSPSPHIVLETPSLPLSVSENTVPPVPILAAPSPLSHPHSLTPLPVLREVASPPLGDAQSENGLELNLGDLGLGLDFGHSVGAGEDVEPALGRNQSKRLSAQGPAGGFRSRSGSASASRSRAGSITISRRQSRAILVPDNATDPLETLNTPASCRNSVAASRRNSRAPLRTPDAELLPPLDTSVDALQFGSRSRAASTASSSSSRVLDETVSRRRKFRKSSLVGDVLRFAPASPGRPSPLNESEGSDVGLGSLPLDATSETHRASILSTANDIGHDDLSPETDYGYASPFSTRSPDGYASPSSTRSPERHYPSLEGYSSPFSTRSPERQFSSPYSTPSVTTDARSPDSSWSGHDTTEFDYGWPAFGEARRFPSSSSESDYGEERDGDDVRGRWDLQAISQQAAPPPPTPISGVGSIYTDEELAAANTSSNGQLAPAYVFPPRGRIAPTPDPFEPGTSAGTIRASSQRPAVIPRSDSLWQSPQAEPEQRPSVDDAPYYHFSKGPKTAFFPMTSDSESADESEGYERDHAAAAEASSDEDDNVPLAKRIPSALAAQHTIRRQVKEEKEQRRREREELRAAAEEPRSRQTTLRPAGAGALQTLEVTSSSREVALQAETDALATRIRQRTQTLPSSGMRTAAVDSLTQKLQSMQANRQNALTIHTSRVAVDDERRLSPVLPTRLSMSASPPVRSPDLPESRGLRAMRSFQRPNPIAPAGSELRARRNTTTHRPQDELRVHGHRAPPELGADVVPPLPSPGLVPPSPSRPTMLSPPSRPSEERIRTSSSQGTLTRIFIGDMQHHALVDIGSTTTARDVLALIEQQGLFKGWVGTGDWMVWELARDFGMQRPVRSFELLWDVQASWNKEKVVNTFVVRITPWASILRRSNIPTTAPDFSGYVEWEYKRGKYAKRFMRLHESSLWLSKRDNGKDEIFLCSLSSFDAYQLTHLHKAPKPFTFAIKSTDNLSNFENSADYVHIFSCNPPEGEKWMELILVARSYFLHQQRSAPRPQIPTRKSSLPMLATLSYGELDPPTSLAPPA
ncbi:hypothetical protein MKEN_00905500 [Mycena kentingensis (nom. inval.)]|nr:hypothetical protein MKEN_00905500 [Mycena kentingensis (nom. inval.)]